MDTRSFHQIEHALLQAEDEIERLRAELATAKTSAFEWRDALVEREGDFLQMHKQFVESQAQEVGLREVISAAEGAIGNFEGYEPLLGWIQDVITLPTDHSALDALLIKARAEERERCAEAVEKLHTWVSAVAVSSAIRALGDQHEAQTPANQPAP